MIENLHKDPLATFLKTLGNEEVQGRSDSYSQKQAEECDDGCSLVYQGGELCPVVGAKENSTNLTVQADLGNGVSNEKIRDTLENS